MPSSVDPITTLTSRFSAAVVAAFGPEFADVDPVVRRSQSERFGDFQMNGAMALAKRVGRPPRDIAAAVVEAVELSDVAESVEIAGPGFVNVTLLPSWIGAAVEAAGADPRLGVGSTAAAETVVVDYSSPNVAKEMHVGHLRSTVIGDALVRVLDFLGHRVIRQNHLGDWGTQFGMLIEHLVSLGSDGGSIEDLNVLYREAQGRFRSDEQFAEQARKRVVDLQGGDGFTLSLWQGLVGESQRHFEAAYDVLGVTLTPEDVRGESFYNDLLDETVAEFESLGLLRLDEGALCAFPPGFTGRDGTPLPLIVRKSDGGYGYAATDLAALRYRVRALGATRVAYVVDARQSSHFAMVFAVAEQAGWIGGSVRAEHVAFGTILGPDGRPFKTREGDTVRLATLLSEAVERAAAVVAEKSRDLPDEEQAVVARAVGIGGVKYADLANDRVKDYVFDWDRMLAKEGNTAPYLQYAHARIQSMLTRAELEGLAPGGPVVVEHAAERALALQLLGFDEAVQVTALHLEPHRLCTYLFELASVFTTFYESCPVLRAESDELRSSRLLLAGSTARVLRVGLGVLGIETPDRM
ncbi:MAG TPA: arginine--tRNA ligase [Mycobacteriales bacterium]|nr:arginine--tRNA ligase [Mycobacteriales bacterium]